MVLLEFPGADYPPLRYSSGRQSSHLILVIDVIKEFGRHGQNWTAAMIDAVANGKDIVGQL